MCFLKKDSKWVFFVAILYIPVNYWISKDNIDNGGEAVYNFSILDWSTWYYTLGAFIFQACVMYVFNYCIALCTQKKMGFVEDLKHKVEDIQKKNEFAAQRNDLLIKHGQAGAANNMVWIKYQIARKKKFKKKKT